MLLILLKIIAIFVVLKEVIILILLIRELDATLMLSHLIFSLFDYAEEIKSAVLLVHGDKAFSYYASEKVMKKLKGDNKEFYTVKGAGHCDLYDGGGKNFILLIKLMSSLRNI